MSEAGVKDTVVVSWWSSLCFHVNSAHLSALGSQFVAVGIQLFRMHCINIWPANTQTPVTFKPYPHQGYSSLLKTKTIKTFLFSKVK